MNKVYMFSLVSLLAMNFSQPSYSVVVGGRVDEGDADLRRSVQRSLDDRIALTIVERNKAYSGQIGECMFDLRLASGNSGPTCHRYLTLNKDREEFGSFLHNILIRFFQNPDDLTDENLKLILSHTVDVLFDHTNPKGPTDLKGKSVYETVFEIGDYSKESNFNVNPLHLGNTPVEKEEIINKVRAKLLWSHGVQKFNSELISVSELHNAELRLTL